MMTILSKFLNAIPKEIFIAIILVLGVSNGIFYYLYDKSLNTIAERDKTIEQMKLSIESSEITMSQEAIAKQGLANQLLECQNSSTKLFTQLEENKKLVEGTKNEQPINKELIVEQDTLDRAIIIFSKPIPNY